MLISDLATKMPKINFPGPFFMGPGPKFSYHDQFHHWHRFVLFGRKTFFVFFCFYSKICYSQGNFRTHSEHIFYALQQRSYMKEQWVTGTCSGSGGGKQGGARAREHASTRDTTHKRLLLLQLFPSLQITFIFFSSCNLASFQRSENVLLHNYAHHLTHHHIITGYNLHDYDMIYVSC